MRYAANARTALLNQLQLVDLTGPECAFAEKIELSDLNKYYVTPKLMGNRYNSGESQRYAFGAYPVVISSNGEPWAEANLFILLRVKNKYEENPKVSMRQFSNLAEDLASFLRFLEEYQLDYLNFPPLQQKRPTYRFRAYINAMVEESKISYSLGRRRIMTVVRFYRWLENECDFVADNATWDEQDHYLPLVSTIGFSRTLKVKSVDITKIIGKPATNPYDEYINDGGNLKPLRQEEQRWLLEALHEYGNTELTLAHYFGLFVGARIQSILTCQRRHFWRELNQSEKNKDFLLRAGPSHGIDTKDNKQLLLYIPWQLYDLLHVYVHSERATRRRKRAAGGDREDQLLFLTSHGNPFYTSTQGVQDSREKRPKRRYTRAGGTMRTLITENIIPYIREKYDENFSYQVHDLRATFGMNIVDSRVEKYGYTETLRFVQARLGHTSPVTTERYLKYRKRISMAQLVQDSWEAELQKIAFKAMGYTL